MDMDNPRDLNAAGPFEARYLAFLEKITNLRPSLHRYCSRTTGSTASQINTFRRVIVD
jgi:RNA polymerase sigma-70 factor, ECF subfamily